MTKSQGQNVVPFVSIVPFKNSIDGSTQEAQVNRAVSECGKGDNVPLVFLNRIDQHRRCDEVGSNHLGGGDQAQSWAAKIDVMTDRQLKATFRQEFNCYAAMKRRRYTHGAEIHDAFSTFRGFLAYMGPKPFPSATVDRRDTSDPEYSPWKVRWASKAEQTENRRNTVWVRSGPKKASAASVARKQHVSPSAIRKRKLRGWTDDEILAGSRRPRAINFTKGTDMKQKTKQKFGSAKEVKAAFLKKGQVSEKDTLAQVWVKTLAEATGWFVPPLTMKDAGALNTATAQMPKGMAAEVIKYAILHWAEFAAYVEDYAGKWKTPNGPVVGFFVQHAMIASNLYLAHQAQEEQQPTAPEPEPEDLGEEAEPAISAQEIDDLEDDE